ncbi:MAG TPA: hypothetical protein VFD51_00255, partial [Patescibacteria group bacterium]|nr:hypothetical protein [Patescibacteria group bacterium]
DKMKKEIIHKTLKNVFNKLTVNSVGFVEVFGYKTAEIRIRNLLQPFGLGLYEQNPVIKIFYIDNNHKSSDPSDYKPIVSIGRRALGAENKEAWNVEFSDAVIFIENVGNFREICAITQIVHYVMQAIEEEERSILKQS